MHHNLVLELTLEGPNRFRRCLPSTFQSLVQKISPHVKKQETNMRGTIPPAERLSITLRHLATGETQESLRLSCRSGQNTVPTIIREVCSALVLELRKDFLKVPSLEEKWKSISDSYGHFWNFQNCIGAIDGKHIKIDPPLSSGTFYYNYIETFSVVLIPDGSGGCPFEIYICGYGDQWEVPFKPQQPAPENENEEEEEEEDEEESDDGGRELSTSVAESTFQFTDFAKRFCHFRVVQACALLLRQFEQNSVRTNHCTLKLLHRIAWDCKLPAMLFQASIFRTFQTIMDSKDPRHKELIKFAIFIVRKFVEVAKINSKVYMELLFWKSSREAYDVEHGYGSYEEQSHSGKQVWSEEEEFELRRLYEEYMATPERPEGVDVVDWIMQNLINKDRSRRGVVKKLKEMGYVVVTKPGSKNVRKGPPPEWSTEEEEQLTALFSEFKEAMDPLGCILDRLTVKRPKRRVVEKLLAMGLVENKKELYKKRSKKNQNQRRAGIGNGSRGSSGSEINSEDDSDSGSSSDGSTRSSAHRPTKNQHAGPKPPRRSNKSKQPTKQRRPTKFNKEEAVRLLRQVKAAGMTEALNWLSVSLAETAEEYDPNDTEFVPLVPLTEPCSAAMESPLFQQFLRALGMSEPANEQEAYWRIPGTFNEDDLEACRDVINMPESDSFFNTEDLLQETSDVCRRMLSENAEALGNGLDEEGGSSSDDPNLSVLSLDVSSKADANERSRLSSAFDEASQSPLLSKLTNGSTMSTSKGNRRKESRSRNRGKNSHLRDSSLGSDSDAPGYSRNTKLSDDEISGHVSTKSVSTASASKVNRKKEVKSHRKGKKAGFPGSSLGSDSDATVYSQNAKASDDEGFDRVSAKHVLNSDLEGENSKAKKRKKIVSHSSSESESENNFFSKASQEKEDGNNESSVKRLLDSDSETENLPEKKHRKVFLSDDEDD